MTINPRDDTPTLLHPALRPGDPLVRRWLAEVTLRLRREVAWARRRAGAAAGAASRDAAQDSLDQLRHAGDKAAFLSSDPTAAWLGDRIAELRAAGGDHGISRWPGIAAAWQLDDAAQFVLACALAARADASLGVVAAAASPDPSHPQMSLALAQALWDDPLAVVACADPTHALYRSGLLRPPAGRDADGDWFAPLEMPAIVARVLLAAVDEPALPESLQALQGLGGAVELPASAAPLVSWLRATAITALQVVPVSTLRGADTAAAVGALGAAAGRRTARLGDEITPGHPALPALACAAWLHGADLLAPDHWAGTGADGGAPAAAPAWAAIAAIPLRLYLPVAGVGDVAGDWPVSVVAPAFRVPAISREQRVERLAAAAVAGIDAAGTGNGKGGGRGKAPKDRKGRPGRDRRDAAIADATDAARRFRLQSLPLARIEAVLRAGGAADRETLFALAQGEAAIEMAQLAAPVEPRFVLDDVVLPAPQRALLDAIVTAMRTLGRVHHDWGLARAWNEAGLAVMFCGPPGTGKTMAAEALASELGLPIYRIDLSQVVNKYIGETEKNLRRIFDAAEASDCLLFFDEADALFGRRTEVRDSHDRYANIEISYLLERMERFKGLAVLATNRRKDVDEAFGRRLRYVVEFPVPGRDERVLIWRSVLPPPIAVDDVDFDFLGERFEIAGGAIRSAAFNACGQAAARGEAPRVTMADLLVAVRRELEKGGRAVAVEQFGHYAALLEEEAP